MEQGLSPNTNGKDDDNSRTGGSKNESCSSGDSNPCPICLGPFLNESYLDTCFHKFCFRCILHWANVAAGRHSRAPSSVRCPLCKKKNCSIIYDYDGSSFQRHYLYQNSENGSFFSKAHKYRLQCYYTKPGVLSDLVNVSRYWKFHKYLQPNRWLQSWLRREIQALTQEAEYCILTLDTGPVWAGKEEDVEIIVHHIAGVVDSFLKMTDNRMKKPETYQEDFKVLISDAAMRFLGARTGRFADELELFLASGLNIEAYDEAYKERLGWKTPGAASEALEGESSNHTPLVPYLYIFDEDSDETD